MKGQLGSSVLINWPIEGPLVVIVVVVVIGEGAARGSRDEYIWRCSLARGVPGGCCELNMLAMTRLGVLASGFIVDSETIFVFLIPCLHWRVPNIIRYYGACDRRIWCWRHSSTPMRQGCKQEKRTVDCGVKCCYRSKDFLHQFLRIKCSLVNFFL